MRHIFLDTETTGLNPESGDRIVEIGCIEMINRRLTGRDKHFYLNPDRKGHEDAIKVHGLTDEFLADKPRFHEVADELIEFLAGAEIVAHNAGFDIAFLNAELKRLDREAVHGVVTGITDTLAMARELFPGKANSLDALCRRLEVDNSHRTLHGALLDAGLLAEVYIRLTRGQDSLVMVHEAEAGSAQADLSIDLSSFDIKILLPTEEELQAHAAVLADLDKASGGKTIWHQAVA